MTENFFGGSGQKKLPKHKLKKLIQEMNQSYKKADELKAKHDKHHQEEEKEADEWLEDNLKKL